MAKKESTMKKLGKSQARVNQHCHVDIPKSKDENGCRIVYSHFMKSLSVQEPSPSF